MKNIALASQNQRQTLFARVGSISKMPAALIEKDFWVCFILDYLFNSSSIKDTIKFKGGTSLSKGYDLIQRFSEDIDLLLDFELIGHSFDEITETRSNNKQDALTKKVTSDSVLFVKNHLLPEIHAYLNSIGLNDFNLTVEEKQPTILFDFPKTFVDNYITPSVKLEFGALAMSEPSEVKLIQSYVHQFVGETIGNYKFQTTITKPFRTFLEKLTLLHKLSKGKKQHAFRYARHYYDVFMMYNSDVYREALDNLDLLAEVIFVDKKFYVSGSSNLDEILAGRLKLLPHDDDLSILAEDYAAMKYWFISDAPTLDEIIKSLVNIEKDVNNYFLVKNSSNP